ncbi:U-box domain-containing protein 7-like [Hibiscus syriacus]|uniref:U-box domain-containing protein 7-like n=1 Tax=Hibiscus syriacus TaxID=106335 RepID=UPI001924E267|nr:U-box domain-containing protein 7-like [Hibiscus syriacus]
MTVFPRTYHMELGAAESVDLPYYSSIKVHRLMCSELKKLIDSVSYMFSALEAARPRCTPGVRALCTLQSAMDKANLLIQHCSESSKFDLVLLKFYFSVCIRSKRSLHERIQLNLGIDIMVPGGYFIMK